ncbi:MAG: GatB/YqeY domain-containing protein [Chloroflexota bacterium]|nr:GatB/YqeY domain-containing protein [Chloroflexota bacterium]
MTLQHTLQMALTTAMKAQDKDTKRTLRLVLTEIKLAEVNEGGEIDDSRIFSILQKELKTREDSILEARTVNRIDLIIQAEKEIEILNQFLPKQMSQKELEQLAHDVIKEIGANSIKDMGTVMKNLMPKLKGRASGQDASRIVQNLLQNN